MIFSLTVFLSILPEPQVSEKPAMTLFLLIVFGIYFLLLLALIAGWQIVTQRRQSIQISYTHTITVIIPFRNEAMHLPGIVADLNALFAKHPALSDPAAQAALVAALGQAAASTDDATMALIAADQKAHGG